MDDVRPASRDQLRRGWSWAALAWALVTCVLAIPSFGLIVVLSPIGVALSAMAWKRGAHDGVFWVAFAVNASAFLGLAVLVIGLFTGEVGVGLD